MVNEIRSTIYLDEDLYKRFREACNKKFGDKQGKIKQGYVLAITNFANEVLVESIPKPPSLSDVLAKELEESKTQTPQEVVAETETPQEVVEIPKSIVDTPPISATKLDQAETYSVDKGLQALLGSLHDNKEAERVASTQLTNLVKLQPTEELTEKERLDKVRKDQEYSNMQTQSNFVGENSIEAKAKRLAERRRKVEEER
jgi:hypothetical protein